MKRRFLLVAVLVFSALPNVGGLVLAGPAPQVQFQQWQNALDGEWANGDINASNSSYFEGNSIPYRLEMQGLNQDPGEVVELAISYTYQRTAHAFDFATSYDTSERPAPFAGSPRTNLAASQCNFSALAIPDDPSHPFDNAFRLVNGPQYFTICHDGTFLIADSIAGPVLTAGSSEDTKEFTIRFETDATEVAFFWGGHLALTSQWELFDGNKGAAFINGSPYHIKSTGFMDDNANGERDGGEKSFTSGDRGVQAGAVLPLPALAVTKTANPTAAPEGGSSVEFTIVATNSWLEDVTLTALTDSDFDLTAHCPDGVGTPLSSGESYTCSFVEWLEGDADGPDHVNTVTVQAIDDEGNTTTTTDDATVAFTDLPASISVIKTADPPSVPEPGADVEFAVVVENTSPADSVTITGLIDDQFGDIGDSCGTSLPASLAPGETITCMFTEFIGGNAHDTHSNLVTASGVDDDGYPLHDDDPATVTIANVPSAIEVIKTATPDRVNEPGGDVTFGIAVNNLSSVDDVTIVTLVDTVYGDLNGQGDCSMPQTLHVGGSYSCSFSAFVSGDAGDTEKDVVIASGTDDDDYFVSNEDTAVVRIGNVASAIEVTKTAIPDRVDEPGGDVTFGIMLSNLSSADEITIDSLVDTTYGDLDGQGDCSLPQTLAAGGSYSCSFYAHVSGGAGDTETNVVIASGSDDDGNSVYDEDMAVVTVANLPSAIQVIKTATPDSVDEPGGNVDFEIVVNNLSAVDEVTIDTLTASVYGNLDGRGSCSLPQTLPAGGSYACSFTAFVSGIPGETEADTVAASGTDDDGYPVRSKDAAVVTIADVPSAIQVTKTVSPDHVDEPGGSVTFQLTVNNLSTVDDVVVTSLTDTVYGDLDGRGDCALPQGLPVGGLYSCSFTAFVAGDPGDTETSLVTASGTDDDGYPVRDGDATVVTVTDAPSVIEVSKTATPDRVQLPGGDVTFHFAVTNLSAADEIIITTMIDTIYGNLNGRGDCSLPQKLQVGGSFACSFTASVSGQAGEVEVNIVTVAGIDDDGFPVHDDDTASVTIDPPPTRVELLYFTAARQDSRVVIEWATAWEQNNWSFNLYRSIVPSFEGATWIRSEPARGWGQFEGQTYRYEDPDAIPGQTYYYWLEDVDVAGSATQYGPETAGTSHSIFLPFVSR